MSEPSPEVRELIDAVSQWGQRMREEISAYIAKLKAENESLRTRLAATEEIAEKLRKVVRIDEEELAAARRALERLAAELSSVQIEAVREGCGNTNAAVLALRVEEARALLAPERPK